jgi:hypothetical protein
MLFRVLTLFCLTRVSCGANKLLLVVESAQQNLAAKFVESFGLLQRTSGVNVDAETIVFNRKSSEDVYKG